jgi:hypothetical protein
MYYLTQVIDVNINSHNSWYDETRMAVYISSPPCQSPKFQSRYILVKGNPTKILDEHSQNCQGHQKQGNTEKLLKPKGV